MSASENPLKLTSDGQPKPPKALEEKYTITSETLGFGTFAVVRVCVHNETKTRRAVKIIARKPLSAGHGHHANAEVLPARQARDEIKILLQLHHPNILRLWDVFETEEALFMITDLCEGGELFDSIVKRVSYNEHDAGFVTREILRGVVYLHQNKIVHRDLKPENILLMAKDSINHVCRSALTQIVISDFGLAKIMPDEGLMLTACGSPQYVAPEVLLGVGYNGLVDVWSVGVIVYALLSGYTPFYSTDVQTLFQRIITFDYKFDEQYWADKSDVAKDFVRKCLCDRSERMTAQEALEHPWIAQVGTSDAGHEHIPPLKRALEKSVSATKVDDTNNLAIRIERMEEIKRVRSQRQTSSSESEQHLGRFLRDFKDELNGFSKRVSTSSTDKGKSREEPAPRASDVSKPLPGTGGKVTKSGESQRAPLSYTRHYIRESASGSQPQKETKTAEVLNELLEHYRTAKRPSFSRVDPSIEVKPNSSTTLQKAVKMVPTLFNQGLSIGGIIASHAIYGPPKKSWGVEMSVLTKTIREISKHTDLTTVPLLQKVFDLARFLPVPEDGLVTPVTFRVKRRNLPGMLADDDAKENGKRELTGEWIVGKQTWRRLQSEWQSGKRSDKERVILYIHGGAYFVMSAITHRPLTIALSKYCDCRVFCINYRLAPDSIFPGALLDCVAAWFRLTDDLHIPPANIVLAADSAGGGLAIALMMYLRDNKFAMPGGAILFSPWVDLTLSCDSWETNKDFDYLPRPNNGDHMHPVAAYLGPNFDKYLTHPYVSPLFGDMHGLPPLLIQTGDAEVLRDENILFAHKCTLAGVPVRHEIYEDCVHVFQFFLFLDASRKALQSARHFMRTALDKQPKRQATKVTEDTREQLNTEMSGGMNNAQGQKVDSTTGAPSAQEGTEPEEEHEHVTLKNFGPTDEDEEDWALDGSSDADKEEGEKGLPRDPTVAAKKAESAADSGAKGADTLPSMTPRTADSESQAASNAPPSEQS
ncbi:hypothetical protein MBRA1_003175 [Malassezia brasiliensis]|uniref:Protein kinase domain-containing protein n=1 Tax=Malassezia brasiliensis TaxID=1821822 RepID=A0AAF0DVG0_9BASI|nr:hypothetical protein MBRA1_003175 [Malassezia brasiliensis]